MVYITVCMDKVTKERKVIYGPSVESFGRDFGISGVGIEPDMPPEIWRRPHGYDAWLLIYLQGQGVLGAEQVSGEAWVLWAPGQAHHYGCADGPWTHLWISLRGDSIAPIVKESGVPLNTVLTSGAGSILSHYIEQIYHELIAYSPPDLFLLTRQVEMCLHELGRLERRASGESRDRLPSRFRELRAFIEANIHRPLSLDELAEQVHLSNSHFIARFHDYFQFSPLQYVKQQRMRRASSLLDSISLSVGEVASRVGYDDPLYFSRQFKKVVGKSPSDWRKDRMATKGLRNS